MDDNGIPETPKEDLPERTVPDNNNKLETERLYEEMNNLRMGIDKLKKENENLKQNMASSGLKFNGVKDNEDCCILLTGLKPIVLKSLMNYSMKAHNPSNKPTKLSIEDQIMLTIIKLKHNPVFELLALLFNISLTTCIEYFWKWIDIMFVNIKRLIKMQDRDNIFNTIPAHFKCKFLRLTSIIDCFEVFVEAPSSMLARARFYSQYKKHTTIKVFISCTPLGAINFVSQCYGGRPSDIQVVKESGFHTSKYHMPGDQVLADRGFTLVEEFAAGTCFYQKKDSIVCSRNIEISHKIASVRIHIERGLLRNQYTILKGTIPLRLLKSIKDEKSSSIIANCDKLVVVCSVLTNLNRSIIFDKNTNTPVIDEDTNPYI
ncbi:uncharacterized protein [Clytia hemisphaerica]|uniref:uncharacterized protein n=1 Tax=Clytia hemisphaerica TaxID=252671 RepID=UPI0034D74575